MGHLINVQRLFAALFLGVLPLPAAATTYYVDINSPNPTPPYTDWSTAATNIQSAIDQAANGDLVLVNDGVYQTGGETINGHALTNRVAINKSITVQSVDGPAVTVIQGNSVAPYASGGIRCVYMTNNASLIGFTLTGGSTSPNNTTIYDESGGGIWCESTNSISISNCVITGNAANYSGGGVYQGTLLNCTLFQNAVVPYNINNENGFGGGACQSVLINCMLISNSVTNVFFRGINQAAGGGAYNSLLTNCVVADNLVATNFFGADGGGAFQCTLVNCTITGNSAYTGGGVYAAVLTNCIDYYNNSIDPSSPNWFAAGTIRYSCTTPMPPGPGNITNAPLLASISCISTNSPCRGAGNAAATSGADINGNPWANPPSMGCDEPYPGNVIGTNVTAGIATSFTSYPPGYVANFQAAISGPVSASVWNFGDGTIVTNLPFISHSWPAVGTYPVTLTAYNDTYPTGVMTTLTINVSTSLVYYVNLNNGNPVPPYRTFDTAAVTIQDAVNAANPGSLVLVTNGTTAFPTNHNALYFNGGMTAPNGSFYRVVVTNPITVESVWGPSTTFIVGGPGLAGSAGCVYLTNGAALIGFTLTNGINGGIYAASTNVLITNCVITHCSGGYGGAYLGTLINCLFTNSSGAGGSVLTNCTFVISGEQDCLANNCVISNNNGTGAYGGTLNNCWIVGNSSSGARGDSLNPLVLNNCVISNNSGGGVFGVSYPPNYTNCILNNCIVVSNLYVGSYGGGATYAQLNNCIIRTNRSINGGVAYCLLTNCSLIANTPAGSWESVLNDCTIINNLGAGAVSSTINQCIVSNNAGGGIANSTATDCQIIGNQYGGQGAGAYSSTLNGCTILGNVATNEAEGAGAANCSLNDCLISSNMIINPLSSVFSGGGGVWNCRVTNCLLTYNFCATNGGAAYQSTLVNCTVAFNSGTTGGVYQCQAKNCILYYNSGADYYPNTGQYSLNYCCTPVLPTNGFFNVTSAPLFVNAAGNDFHLQSTSPCINSGNNAYISVTTDLDGNPRIMGGTVDIGAYEYQTPTSVISYAYLQQYGLPTDGSVDFLDLDGSGFNVYQDWIAGLNPTNPASVLIMLSPPATNNTAGITVTWQSVSGILYNLQRTTNLPTPFSTIQSNIVGNAGTTSYTDTSATNNFPYFYRVGVP
jgi:hypothetical protein